MELQKALISTESSFESLYGKILNIDLSLLCVMSCKDSFIRYPLLIVTIIIGTGMVLMFQNSTAIEAGATTLTQDDSNITTSTLTTTAATTSNLNNTFHHDSVSEINKLTSAFGLPFYELTDAKDTGKEVPKY